jgi:DNA-binding Xre family transcriptional regulator
MAKIMNALPEVMGRHRVKQAALAEASGLRYATVNALYNGKTERVDFTTLAAVLDGLNNITGESYTVADLLKYTPGQQEPALTAAGVPYTGDAETDAVLNTQPDILARIARLEQDTSKLVPLQEIAAKYGVEL